jgi:Amt family ammonium transporter
LAIEFIDKVCRIDDPVGVIGVHGICGLFGTLAVGLFATDGGLFYGGGLNLFGTQIIGAVSVLIWVIATMTIVFLAIKHSVGLRVSAKEEVEGLDASEHGLASAYADFTITSTANLSDGNQELITLGTEKMETAVPVTMQMSPSTKASKMTKVEILMKQAKFEAFKTAMNQIGVTGMTVTQVLGCGVQKGAQEYYRGVEVDMQLLPKIQVEMVLAKVPVMDVIETARKILYTGHIGDGKIFVYDVENVVKVRTGETGYDALQGLDD